MENRMGTEKVSRLVLVTGIPLMLSLLINSLYNFVDSIFVARIEEDALTALSLSAPVQVFVSALGFGNAVGLNAAVSKALGEKNTEKVKRTANSAVFIAVCEWLIIVLACLVFVRPFFLWQSGGNERIMAYGWDYLSICMLFSLGQMGQWVFDRFVIASGKSYLFLFTLSAASITNLILDPVFIFLLGMGTKGAAIATVTDQFFGMSAGIYINRRWNKEIPFSFAARPDRESIWAILRVGMPSTLVQILTGFVSVAMNTILLTFSTTAVAVFGVCTRMQGTCTVGVHGIDNGLIPIVAYNYGAQKKARILEAVKWGLIYSALFYSPFILVLELFPDIVMRLFNASTTMMNIGEPAVRHWAVAWLLSIPNLVISSALQGLSMARPCMILTMLRQAVLPVLSAFLLRNAGEVIWIWSAFSISEALCIPLAVKMWKKSVISV